MSLTAQQVAKECLSFIGEFILDAFTQFGTARAAILSRIARDINAACQEIFRARPDLFRQRLGFTISAPETQTVTATANSRALTFGVSFACNLDGATVNIGGQWNECRKDGATVSLVNPYTGSTGSVSMTAYGDSILMDAATVARVIGNVEQGDRIPLAPLTSRQEFLHYESGFYSDYGRRGSYSSAAPRVPGLPEAYWVESYLASDGLKLRLRLAPLPDRALPIALDAEMRPAAIVVGDFGTDAADPGKTFSLPADMAESLLLPLVLKRWSGSAWFKEADKIAEISDQAKTARMMLSDFRPQAQSGATIVVCGYR
jgi:hypothetical protein